MIKTYSEFLTETPYNNTKFFHGSMKLFVPNTILIPNKGGGIGWVIRGEEFEEAFDKIRKETNLKAKISRFDCVYMFKSVEECLDHFRFKYVYEVKPIGDVERGNLGWHGDANVAFSKSDYIVKSDMIEYTINYWEGKDHPREPGLFEYRTPKAKVIRKVWPK